MVSSALVAQESSSKKKPKQSVKSWQIVDKFATVDSIPVDTLHLNFQNDNHIDKFSIANAYRSNLGSPIQSKIFFDRPLADEFIFADAYYPYQKTIESATFYNTTTPFSSIYALSGGKKYYEDEQIRFLFTANANKKLNFGTTLDYIYARGEYAKLSTKRFAGSLFGSYDGQKYKATGFIAANNHNNFESGGIQDTSFINGTVKYDPKNIPVNINAYATFKHNQLFYNHQYNIGIEREKLIEEDSIVTEYVPVTIFAHTLQIDDMRKRYYEESVEKDFYENTYLPFDYTNDSTTMLMINNRLSISMAEEFNKWLKFGLTAYIENDVVRYGYMVDSLNDHKVVSNTSIGAVLSKHSGRLLRYNIAGEMTLLGRRAGDVKFSANLNSNLNLWNFPIQLEANGFIKSVEPSFFHEFYHSNHFKWDQQLVKVYNTHLDGTLIIPKTYTKLNLAVGNITNYTYYGLDAIPHQYSGNIQVLSANLQQDLRFGPFALENHVIYQLSSNQAVLPLPDLTLYHNLYYHGLWFKVLSMQIGADVRYHTSYYAPAYMPAIGQFYVQDNFKIGNYPVMNAYINAHLKRVRFFVQYNHINQLFMKGDYYSMPYYPINQARFKVGLTWNFYD